MTKKEKNIQERFYVNDQKTVINQKRKEETLLLLQEKIAAKQVSIMSSKRKILLNQIRYMDKSMMSLHLLLCILLLLIASVIKYYRIEEENVILFSMVISCILGVISIAEVSRIFFSGIMELSESCYFNVRQIVAFQMAMSGIINLTVLFPAILFVGTRWEISILQAGLYTLVPFVMTECCCLGSLLLEVGRRNSYLLIMIGVFLIVFYMILAQVPELYQITALSIWGIAFVAGILLLGVQIKILFQGIKKGEIICMN